jgi:DNA mismatch endonuclease Vsr
MPAKERRQVFADVPDGRRRIMRAIRSAETAPERALRSQLHAAGFRFKKNVRGLPGRPDVVFSARKKVIFVHGCFWHAHSQCANAAIPRTRTDYWKAKLDRNVARDKENIRALHQAGWQAYVVWECELANLAARPRRLFEFLGAPKFSRKALNLRKRAA